MMGPAGSVICNKDIASTGHLDRVIDALQIPPITLDVTVEGQTSNEAAMAEQLVSLENQPDSRRDNKGLPIFRSQRRVASQNRLLSNLSPRLKTALAGHLTAVSMPKGRHLWEMGDPLSHVYFPVDCIILLAQTMSDGCTNEVAVVGNEAVTSVNACMGCNRAPTSAIVLHPGTALRMNLDRLREEFTKFGELHVQVLRYAQALMVQVGQTVACFRHHSIQQQVSSLLLACLDRVRSQPLMMTHEVISGLLGVRRVGVTEELVKLRLFGAITGARGEITVVDSERLTQCACECYSVVKKEFERLRTIAA